MGVGRHDAFIHAEEKQGADLIETGPPQIPGHDTVRRCRDHSHRKLRKAGGKDLQILPFGYGLLA